MQQRQREPFLVLARCLSFVGGVLSGKRSLLSCDCLCDVCFPERPELTRLESLKTTPISLPNQFECGAERDMLKPAEEDFT
jgi:hypothetical protein